MKLFPNNTIRNQNIRDCRVKPDNDTLYKCDNDTLYKCDNDTLYKCDNDTQNKPDNDTLCKYGNDVLGYKCGRKKAFILVAMLFSVVFAQESAKLTSIKPPARKKTFVEFFTGREYKYECGNFDFSAENQVGILRKDEGTVYFNTELKMAGFEADYYSQLYYIYMNDSARKTLAANVNQYLSDFENRALKLKGKTYKQYGEVPIRLEWGTIPTMVDSYGNGSLQFGYRFYKKAPYFTLTVWPVKNLETRKAAATSKSVRVQYYFTKAQAQKLAELLSDENLLEVLKPYIVEPAENNDKGSTSESEAKIDINKPNVDEY